MAWHLPDNLNPLAWEPLVESLSAQSTREVAARLDEACVSGLGQHIRHLQDVSEAVDIRHWRQVMLPQLVSAMACIWWRTEVMRPPGNRTVYRGVLVHSGILLRLIQADVLNVLGDGQHLNTTQLYEAASDLLRGEESLWLAGIQEDAQTPGTDQPQAG